MQDSTMQELWNSSHIGGVNAEYVEALYNTYLHSPDDIPEEWREYFQQLPPINGLSAREDTSHSVICDQFRSLAKRRHSIHAAATAADNNSAIIHERKQAKVAELIQRYHAFGHRKAKIDPLGLRRIEELSYLDIGSVGLDSTDLGSMFKTDGLFFGKETATLKDIVGDLEAAYCGSIGAEITHLTQHDEIQWLSLIHI